MFEKTIYQQRRRLLKKGIKSGILLFLGNEESPVNYPANSYPFRQDSSFLYFFGLNSPGLAAVIDIDEEKETLFGMDLELEDIIWTGPRPRLRERALEVGVRETAPFNRLAEAVKSALQKKRTVHFLPPYRRETALKISELVGRPVSQIRARASNELIAAVAAQRSIKSKKETEEIEKALGTASLTYQTAMSLARPGHYEREIRGAMEGIVRSHGRSFSFLPIVTVNGHIFHNTDYGNRLQNGRMLLIDSGVESELGYACDITRSVPVGGRFSRRQREIYEIVLKAQLESIRAMKPGVRFRDIHLLAARVIAEGLKDVGLMKGDLSAAVKEGAHALFFPHGLGHQMGLDVHDMENLGEDHVGYDETVSRSRQFGLAYLRMAKELKPGHVMTVEPGIYFIPALIETWKKQKKFEAFINYARLESFLNFGGIRIEDDVLVLEKGHRILGRPIPKTPQQIEQAMA